MRGAMTDPADLVLEGGGVKGIALVGAAARLERDYHFERIAGSSVGALVGALLAAGVSGDELRQTLVNFPFASVPQKSRLARVPLIGRVLALLFSTGIYRTQSVREWVATRLEEHGVRTFADLRNRDNSSSLSIERQYRLVVTATDITSGELLYLPWDYEARFGLDPDAQLVADAVAASIAVPLYYEPLELTDVRTGQTHVLVDGGVLSNYPITIFDRTDNDPPRWPTFGIKIIPRLPAHDDEMVPFASRIRLKGVRQLEAVVATMIAGRDQTYLERPCVAMRTMQVDTHEVTIFDVGLADATKKLLFDRGWDEADRFIAGFDWDLYRKQCGDQRDA
jgi:NTE family protein